MVLLIFALHLPTLSPPLLSQIKQCLLEIANLYALSPPTPIAKHGTVDDMIGLFYFQRSDNSSSDELEIAYSPRGKGFSLRDFHYAVNHLASDSYSPPIVEDSFMFCDLDISCLLSHQLLHSTSGKDIDKKIVLISSCLVANMDSNIRKCLLDAADRCVSVEFVFLEQNSNQLSDISDSINKFREQICDLENCSFNAYLPDGQVLNGLVKRWVGELRTDDIMQWQAYLVFKRSIAGSVNEVFCKMCNSTNYIMDEFSPCKPCRCSWDGRDYQMSKDHFSCYDRNVNRGPEHTDRHSMKVDEHTLLTEELWSSWMGHCPVSSAVYLNVTERTSLASLSEGVMVGRTYIVIPSASMETDTTEENDKCRLNNSREVELKDYNPVQHNGGFHQKINQHFRESLQSRLVNSDISATASDTTCHDVPAVELSLATNVPTLGGGFSPVTENDSEIVELTQEWKQLVDGSTPKMKSTPSRSNPEKCISKEWEQLIIGGDMTMKTMPPEPNMEETRTSPTITHRPLDTRTSKILERLGNPKQLKNKVTSPSIAASNISANAGSMTQNHLSAQSDTATQGLTVTSCLLKPTFHRLKRKQR